MDLREIGWEGVNWIHMDRVRDHWRAIVNMEMNLRVPQKSGEFLDYLSDSAPLSQLVSYLVYLFRFLSICSCHRSDFCPFSCTVIMPVDRYIRGASLRDLPITSVLCLSAM